MNKTIVLFVDDKQLELDADGIGFHETGAIILTTGTAREVVGMFMPHTVKGIYHPDGPNLVKAVEGVILK